MKRFYVFLLSIFLCNISIAETYNCDDGYYLPANNIECIICPVDHYCSGGTYTFDETTDQGITECSAGTFAPTGMWKITQCGRKLHIGNEVLYMKPEKNTQHALAILYNGTTYYANASRSVYNISRDSDLFFKTLIDNKVYYIYDDSGSFKYTPIEYLESDGQSYIKTDFIPDNNTGVKAKFKILEIKSPYGECTFFGSGASYAANNFELYTYYSKLELNYNGIFWGTTVQINDILEIDWNKNIMNFSTNNGNFRQIVSSEKIFTTPYALNILGVARPNLNSTAGKIQLYYFKIYDNNVLVHDMIPVLDKDGTPCMYDKVTDVFFYNAGAGDFTAGPIL